MIGPHIDASTRRRLRAVFLGNRLSGVAVILTGFVLALALFGGFLTDAGPTDVGVGTPLDSPSWSHLMGTDELGRDVFSRVATGTRVSLQVGLVATLIASAVGISVGAMAGFAGGFIDGVLTKLTELFMVIPRFFLALVVVALFGANLTTITVAIGALSWPITSRVVRTEVRSLRSRQHVDAARVAGCSNLRLVMSEILPLAMGSAIVTATLMVGQAILIEAGLSYLGLGDASSPSLGLILRQAQSIMDRAWWVAVFPGLMIFVTVLASNLLGDALNDYFDPRTEARE